MLIEACVDSPESAVAAENGGATRVELCAALLEGGLTPSTGAIALAREKLGIGLHVIIRPRGGDFLYTGDEHAVMLRDIDAAKNAGADGVVVGVLDANAQVDEARTRELVECARPMSVTFHRAFDMTRDPFAALETLVDLGIDRILTSGQEESAMAGLELLRELVKRAGGRIIIMPAGNIHENNVKKIAKETGAKEPRRDLLHRGHGLRHLCQRKRPFGRAHRDHSGTTGACPRARTRARAPPCHAG